MTDKEFDILDELYFVTSFPELKSNSGMSCPDLIVELRQLIAKSWIKCIDPDTEQDISDQPIEELEKQYETILFLATKKGLMEHNSRS